MLEGGERGYGDDSTPMRDSAVLPCFHGCLAFLHSYSPPRSPPLRSLDLSLCSQQKPSPWDCSTVPKLQLPAAAPSRGPVSLSGVCMAAARTVWFSFHLGCHRSAVSLFSLKCFSSDSDNPQMWGSDSPDSVSPPAEGRSRPTNTSVSPPSSVILLSFAWFYIFFPTGRVLLSALNRCSACTSVSEGVSLMYPWREMYSTSTHSPAILFS